MTAARRNVARNPHSGSGKSTLVNLICRFYNVAEGAILLDGTDVHAFAVADCRRHIGLVLQEPFLFFGTIAENIAYGKPHATRQEIIACARAADAHEFILRLPQGYDSMVGEAALLVADSHGIQFLVRDMFTIDKHSRKILDRFL